MLERSLARAEKEKALAEEHLAMAEEALHDDIRESREREARRIDEIQATEESWQDDKAALELEVRFALHIPSTPLAATVLRQSVLKLTCRCRDRWSASASKLPFASVKTASERASRKARCARVSELVSNEGEKRSIRQTPIEPHAGPAPYTTRGG
jgi:hypothetical protein